MYGAYFNHESETAGLGAEIKDSQAWQEKFIGKQIWDESGNVVLSVVKDVKDPNTQVDCVTGATLTSNGVDAMIKAGLQNADKPSDTDCCGTETADCCQQGKTDDCCKEQADSCLQGKSCDNCKAGKPACCQESKSKDCCSSETEIKAKEE